MGILHPQNGHVRICGRSTDNIPVEEHCYLGVGYLWQTTNVFPALTVIENIDLAAMGGNRSRDYIFSRMSELLDKFPMLKKHLRTRAGLLSGGGAAGFGYKHGFDETRKNYASGRTRSSIVADRLC